MEDDSNLIQRQITERTAGTHIRRDLVSRERCLTQCVPNNTSKNTFDEFPAKIMNTNDCVNNNFDRFNYLFKSNQKFLKIIHFNAQG